MNVENVLADTYCTSQNPCFTKLTAGSYDDILHKHMFFEIFYITSGTIDHFLNGETDSIEAGDIFFLNLDDAHAFMREQGNLATHRDIIIRKDFFEEICMFLGDDFYNKYISGNFPKKLHLTAEQITEYENWISQIPLFSMTNPDLTITNLKFFLCSILSHLVHSEADNTARIYPQWFEDILSRINDFDCTKDSLAAVLAECHFDRSYVCRYFKKTMGCTMTDYLNDVRLRHAATLLQYSSVPILEVASNVGFASLSYFNKIFKAKYGVSPKEYRKKQRVISGID